MEFNDEQKEIIINAAAFGYDVEKTASILQINKEDLESEAKNKESEYNKLQKFGSDMFEYTIDTKLFELARMGDIKALEQLEHRKKIRMLEAKK